jgi:hypothetical protein
VIVAGGDPLVSGVPREPDGDAEPGEVADDLLGLLFGERALVFADDDSVERPAGLGGVVQELGGGGALVPGQAAAVAGVEVLGRDPPVSGDHADGVVVLPLS